MSGGKNGSTPLQNLTQLRQKPVFDTPAEVERSKCPAHPTKRMWEDPNQAIREAEVRSTAAKMPIAAYRCDACGNAHLCKRANAHPGSILEREAPQRANDFEVFVKPGNAEARRKVLSQFLQGQGSVTTEEVIDYLGVGRAVVGKCMTELGWHSTRGRSARWIPNAESAPIAPLVQPLRAVGSPVDKPVELAKRRHPSSQDAGWRLMTQMDRIRHMPIGDLIDTLEAVGLELRIQTRETP